MENPQAKSDLVKKYLQIHTIMAFGLLVLPMVIDRNWWPIIFNIIVCTWFVILSVRVVKRKFLGKLLISINGLILVLSLVHIFISNFYTIKNDLWNGLIGYLIILGTLLPILMWLSLFILYFIYRKRMGEQKLTSLFIFIIPYAIRSL